jgi:hypothetical protein
VAEDCLTFCWFPYWDNLDASKRSSYLDRWHLGPDREWQEWLSFIDMYAHDSLNGGQMPASVAVQMFLA